MSTQIGHRKLPWTGRERRPLVAIVDWRLGALLAGLFLVTLEFGVLATWKGQTLTDRTAGVLALLVWSGLATLLLAYLRRPLRTTGKRSARRPLGHHAGV